MVIEVEIVGNGRYAGAKSNIGEYSVSEESTPVVASDTSGGTGQITFTAGDDPQRLGSVLLLNDSVKLTDGDRGETAGKINSISGNNGTLSITADSRLGQLVVDKQAVGKVDTLSNVLRYYIETLGGIAWTDVALDADLVSIPVNALGWKGDLWTKIKELLVTVGAEISLVRGKVVVRKIRGRRALEINNVSESWEISNIDMARQVEVAYYNTTRINGGLVYPAGGWNENVTVYTIDAGQTTTVNIPVDVWLDDTPLAQPTCVASVSKTYSASSVYAMAGNDGLPITPAQWLADGGKVTVARGADGQSIDVTFVGAGGATAKYAPYRVAMSAGSSNYYSSLRLVGSGVGFTRETVTLPTGVPDSDVLRDVGVTVDNVFIATRNQALDIAAEVASYWAAPKRTITISKADINRPDSSSPNYDYATFADFDAYAATNGITTFAQFDTAWAGKTFGDFDDYWYELVANNFEFQVFGNASGARVQWRRAMYRIRSATTTASGVDYTAEADTTFADFDDSATGMTFADFDTMYAGLTFNDFALIPLANVKPEYDR